MQAMGAYGFRGFYEKKLHFLASIPYALDNLKLLLEEWNSTVKLPALLPLLEALTQSDKLRKLAKPELTVSVNSFSFKRAIPYDESENGGGHVFDCRALPNPGRYISYAHLTGKDQTVIDFLKKKKRLLSFSNIVKCYRKSQWITIWKGDFKICKSILVAQAGNIDPFIWLK